MTETREMTQTKKSLRIRAQVASSRLLIATLGRLSKGINMCFKHGLTAGYNLEYIYENKAHGHLFLGKWIDRLYLDDVGWKAVRQRKDNLRDALVRAIEESRTRGRRVHVLDIAAGLGRYLFEAIETTGPEGVDVACQDLEEKWVDRGNRKAAARGMTNIHFRQGDALDPDAVEVIEPRPTIVVSSGFYDWIVEDEIVEKSLAICHRALADGGRIIFTNQITNPNLDLVCGVFPDHRKQALRMKMRPVEQMTGFAAAAGFKNLRSVTDEWGLYSVTEGQKS
ncbi:MAG: class I SAM-dependent methyltransferase family protein [Planctomycetota bacterium]